MAVSVSSFAVTKMRAMKLDAAAAPSGRTARSYIKATDGVTMSSWCVSHSRGCCCCRSCCQNAAKQHEAAQQRVIISSARSAHRLWHVACDRDRRHPCLQSVTRVFPGIIFLEFLRKKKVLRKLLLVRARQQVMVTVMNGSGAENTDVDIWISRARMGATGNGLVDAIPLLFY